MIKDRVFKNLFIPLLGLFIPLMAGFINWHLFPAWQLGLFGMYFIAICGITWYGVVKLIARLRPTRYCKENLFPKLVILSLATTMFSCSVCFASFALWQWVVLQQIMLPPLYKAAALYAIAVFIITLIYENMFLQAEANLTAKVLLLIDNERMQAEANILQNELDPHFLFNCLNTLTYLVGHNQEKANQLIQKLSKVFKYFLCHRQKDLVPLAEEIKFLDDYYFLLQVRFEKSIQIDTITKAVNWQANILPCTLQALVENAIKHNYFSDQHPLTISICVTAHCLTVSNPVRPKLYIAGSTKTGLRNLRARYLLIMNKAIVVQANQKEFSVQVPLH